MPSRGEEISWWAEKIEEINHGATEVLDEAQKQLSPLDLTLAIAHGHRRLLLPNDHAFVKRLAVLEAHLIPTSGAGFPLFVAAAARFHVAVPRPTIIREFLIDPPLDALLPAHSPLGNRRIIFSKDLRPTSYLFEVRVASWPLLDLECAASIREHVTKTIAPWLDP